MAGSSFRILLVGRDDAWQLGRIREDLGAIEELVARVGIAAWEVDDLPRFDFLQGERKVVLEPHRIPPDTRVSARTRQAVESRKAVAKITLAPGAAFARALEVIRSRVDAWNYDQQGDPAIGPTLWEPGIAFGQFRQAKALIAMTPKRGCSPVNVVIVDQGFDKKVVGPPFGGGWYRNAVTPQLPGEGNSRHANMIARTVRALVPEAVLFDAPLIPTPAPGAPATIADIEAFADDAIGLWLAIWTSLVTANPESSWVFVNAWALSDVSSDRLIDHPRYSTDREHLLNVLLDFIVATRNIDVVFAAGNCGQYQPDSRCGRDDRGPCRSIWGANSLDTVLTVGAVRTDRTWLGYSSQGPGQPALGIKKPDLAAPTQFADDQDLARIYGGTSAAAAVAGAVVAALRSKRPQQGAGALSAADLRDALRATALKPELNQRDHEVGAGVIRFDETFDQI